MGTIAEVLRYAADKCGGPVKPAVNISTQALSECERIVNDPDATIDQHDAALIAMRAHRQGKQVDRHVATVLAGYALKEISQNRWGK